MSKMARRDNCVTTSTSPPQSARRVFLRPNEIALEPQWGEMDKVLDFLATAGADWRLDAVLRCIALDNPSIAKKLQSDFGCKNVTSELRRFLARDHGVRVVGCERFAGMLVYDLADDLLYHVDATSFKAVPVPDFHMAAHFRGLGRAAAHGVSYEFGSMSEAIEAFKEHAKRDQAEWVKRHSVSASPGDDKGD